MSSFSVETHRLLIEEHPNADRLQVARVGDTDYKAVVQKGRFASGERAVFVPDAGVVPPRVLKEGGYWLDEKDRGILSGGDGCRVKATKLRKVLSDGILLSLDDCAAATDRRPEDYAWEGVDHAGDLGIFKYQPEVPTQFAGDRVACSTIRSYTDIEAAKKFPQVVDYLIEHDIEVIATEKVHGSCVVVHLDPDDNLFVSSKGISQRGHAIKEAEGNVYWRAVREYELERRLRALAAEFRESGREAVTLYGEVYGPGVQKGFAYDAPKLPASSQFAAGVGFRAFDLRVGDEFLDFEDLRMGLARAGVPRVPVVFDGPFSVEAIEAVRDGQSVFAPGTLREGVVVRPTVEEKHEDVGRIALKFVSPVYLDKSTGEETQ